MDEHESIVRSLPIREADQKRKMISGRWGGDIGENSRRFGEFELLEFNLSAKGAFKGRVDSPIGGQWSVPIRNARSPQGKRSSKSYWGLKERRGDFEHERGDPKLG